MISDCQMISLLSAWTYVPTDNCVIAITMFLLSTLFSLKYLFSRTPKFYNAKFLEY